MFEGVNRVSGYGARASLNGLDEQSALTNLRAGLGPVQQIRKAIITSGEIGRLQRALKHLLELMEPWIEAQYDSESAAAVLGEVDGMMLVLAMWAADRYRLSGDPSTDPSGSMLGLLLNSFNSGGQVMAAYELVTDSRERSFGEDWGFWFYDSERGGIQNVGGEGPINRATALALMTVAASGKSFTLPASDILRYRGDGLAAALDEIATDERWRGVLPSVSVPEPTAQADVAGQETFERSVASVRDAFETAGRVRTEADAARVREANLDMEQVQRFRRATIQNVASSRVIRDLMAHVGATSSVTAPPESPLLSRDWIHKGFFIGDRSFVGQDMTARDLARRANLSEIQALHELLVEPEPAPAAENDLRDRVIATIHEMRLAGQSASLIMVPIGFELAQALQIQAFGKVKLDIDTIPAAHSSAFRGAIENVPVLPDVRITPDRMFVIDLNATARLEEWPSEAGAGLEVVVRAFDADEATAFVAENPAVIPEGQTATQTVEIVQSQALIEMHRCWRMTASNPRAGICAIEIPAELQRDVDN